MRAIVAVLVLLLTSACGVPEQERPVPVEVSAAPAPGADPGIPPGDTEVEVFFLRGARLAVVSRSTSDADVDSALDLLVAGPTHTEVLRGLRTALAPQRLVPAARAPDSPVVTIDVTRAFTDVSGRNQLRAVGQVVWTATQFPDVRLLRFTAEGQELEVPTDRGLTDQPVGRRDYRSLAPERRTPASSGTATPGSGRVDGAAPNHPRSRHRAGASTSRNAFHGSSGRA